MSESRKTCGKCFGSGTESYRFHGVWPNGEACVEPVKCDDCDGFGFVDDEPMEAGSNSPFRLIGWMFFYEDDSPSGHFFDTEKEALDWLDSEECIWDGYVEGVYAVADRSK